MNGVVPRIIQNTCFAQVDLGTMSWFGMNALNITGFAMMAGFA